MEHFYRKLQRIKDEQNLTNIELGSIIDKKGDAFRIAVKRQSLSKLEIDRLENYFGNSEQGKTKETPPREVRFEDLVAKKVYDKMESDLEYFKNNSLEINQSLALGLLNMDKLKDEMKEMKKKIDFIVKSIQSE